MDRNVKSTRLNIEKHLPITSILKEWFDLKPQIPLISLSKHCSICPFEKDCLVTAEKEDSISLLGKMSPKTQRKYESKGIFTIKQLSYLYKPRRRSRFWGERKLTHQYELQALALRTRKIYTTDLLELPNRDIKIYIDVESIPEQRFHYLIGILISKQGRQHYTPYWANEKFDEKKIWECLIEATNRYPTAPIFHYSGYEKIVINELAKRYDTKADNILDRLSNLNQYIYGRIYFPTRTNRLKDICDYLGFSWTS